MRQIKKKNRRDQFSPKVHNTFMNSHNLKKKRIAIVHKS
jgi:hypothetical protein